MYQLKFDTPIRVHFIGIGGISMSGLAEILVDTGFKVSGSDMKQSALTDGLKAKGVEIYIGQSADNIKEPDLVVYTAAIHPTIRNTLRPCAAAYPCCRGQISWARL